MTHLQEFFGSKDDDKGLVRKLEGCGFEPVTDWTSAYRVDGVFIGIQRIRGGGRPEEQVKHHIARANSSDFGFVMDLRDPLSEYPQDHPLRAFFAELDQPAACGICGFEPTYPVEAYLPQE